MKRWICTVCGYVYEGENASEKCLWRGVPTSEFRKQAPERTAQVREHKVGTAQGSPENTMMDLRANFKGECSEIGMYLAMSRVAHRGGYLETGMYWAKVALEEAEHVVKFAELLGEVVTSFIKKNLGIRATTENDATAGKFDLARKVKALNLDAIHDTAHKVAKGEARHGKAFEGLLKRYFGQEIIGTRPMTFTKSGEECALLLPCV